MVLAVLILPGGLLALFAVAAVRAFSRTETGRRAWGRVSEMIRRPFAPVQPLRQAA